MDGESVAEELLLLDPLSVAHDACVLWKYHHVPGWKGTCIGDCAATISDTVLRVVAFQVVGCIRESNEWDSDAVLQLLHSGAHVCIFIETRVHTQDRHTRIVNAFKLQVFGHQP